MVGESPTYFFVFQIDERIDCIRKTKKNRRKQKEYKVARLLTPRSGKWMYYKCMVVNVVFTGSIPGIMISTGNVKWFN